MKPRFLFFLLSVTVLISCSSFDEIGWTEKGFSVTGTFKQQMMGALKASLEEGPVQGIDVCRLKAPQIAQSLSGETIWVGRTSHKLRNPINAPQDWVKPLLSEYLEADEMLGPKAVKLGTDHVGYVEPIYVQPVCLQCHGNNLETELDAQITALYPEDAARGFENGDFRGFFWVEFLPGYSD
jgi:hypothetical protein